MPKYASARVQAKKTAASTAVLRERKLALPLAPNRLPELPLPKAAPISAPLPCWIRIRPTMINAVRIWAVKITFKSTLILHSLRLFLCKGSEASKL